MGIYDNDKNTEIWNLVKERLVKEQRKVTPDEWMDFRLRLFEHFCLPSVKHQTNQNFKWLIMFNKKTPKKHRNIIERLRKEYSNIIPFYSRFDFKMFKDIIRNDMGDCKQHLITTRFDTDDALNINFIDYVQQSVDKYKKPFVLYFKHGYYLENGEWWDVIYPHNQYPSMICEAGTDIYDKVSSPSIIYDKGHDAWNDIAIEAPINERMWLTNVHKYNPCNYQSYYQGRTKVAGVDLTLFGSPEI